MTIYLDCNATTPIDPEVAELVRYYMEVEYANSGSRTHHYGSSAKRAVESARTQIAHVVGVDKSEVVFTSGATESNNLAILGLYESLKEAGKTHIITTSIEHKAVLEPFKILEMKGFTVDLVDPQETGLIDPASISELISDKTGLISVMHVNNETGSIQPVGEIADNIADTDIYMHVDAAQGFAKDLPGLINPRIDLISLSGHKIYGPKGIGALILRRRNYKRPPLQPLIYGGGQEYGLRAGTLPVALIAGLGKASELMSLNNAEWWRKCEKHKLAFMDAFASLSPHLHGSKTLPNVVNFSIDSINAEAAIVVLKDLIAFSNGSACTSKSYEPSHVLSAMKIDESLISGAMRMSWCHQTEEIPWGLVANKLSSMI